MPPKEKFNVIHRLARKERGTSCHARPGPRRRYQTQSGGTKEPGEGKSHSLS